MAALWQSSAPLWHREPMLLCVHSDSVLCFCLRGCVLHVPSPAQSVCCVCVCSDHTLRVRQCRPVSSGRHQRQGGRGHGQETSEHREKGERGARNSEGRKSKAQGRDRGSELWRLSPEKRRTKD